MFLVRAVYLRSICLGLARLDDDFRQGAGRPSLIRSADPAGLRTHNQFGAQRSKFCDPHIVFQSLTRKIAFGNSQRGALALKGRIQISWYSKRRADAPLSSTKSRVSFAVCRIWDPFRLSVP